MKKLAAICLLFLSCFAGAQTSLSPLTVEKIMRDPSWMGNSPSSPFWSNDGKKLYFLWNPDKAPADSLYYITLTDKQPVKVSVAEKVALNSTGNYIYNQARTAFLYSKNGDIFFTDVKTGRVLQLPQKF